MDGVFEIPLSPEAQSFQIDLANESYEMTLRWNQFAGVWILDLATSLGEPLALGLSLVTGTDLLAQLKYLGVDGELWSQTDNDQDATPTFDNLGLAGRLYFLPSS